MAKQKGIIHLKGKIGETIFTDGKHGPSARSAPELTGKQKQDKALLPQNIKTVN